MRLGIAGIGTVGVGVIKIVEKHGELLANRCGEPIEVVAVSGRDRTKDRGVNLDGMTWYDNAVDLASDPNVDMVLELIGGSEGVARELCTKALEAGKPVVTANKALLAVHGTELATLAEQNNTSLAYEAAVAGGIPIVKAIREGLAGNVFTRVYGILNGTCNYILTEMEETGGDFGDILADAQKLGYAEADPSFDVDGVDAAHKLAILTSLAFGTPVDFDSVYIEGIREVTALDIQFAQEFGYRIRLLGVARQTEKGIEQRVHPCMVKRETAIANVSGVFNAVVAEGDFVDSTVYEGRGAGEGPTASAVMADVIDITSGRTSPTFGIPANKLTDLPKVPVKEHVGCYYVRLTVLDQPGVIADISAAFRDEQVSIESLLQRGRDPEQSVSVVLTTHEVQEEALVRALGRIENFDHNVAAPRMIRIAKL
ncbi:homoserine dehydrogenase [Sneathiella sp. P13V-1]|uniref:homoserine dehydrogenase n=1 Tax=Sneathiella sp. P13V-1 TaxID=2697366 RepID=UPI00187B3781|nr:homoserine dehydrogenase [Sneathiella sp. P13V-1]MBE7636963.1 homoserine dehydrogenase [Sneathiella sp. P13V-1]